MNSSWSDGRLPITLAPREDEALDSWLEAYARRLHTNSRTLLNHIGLSGSALVRMTLLLTSTERQRLTVVTGVTAQQLGEMTLERFDQLAVNIDRRMRTQSHPPAWRRQVGSRYCPACLADNGGRWPLVWRLPWTSTCTRHHQLLADFCPSCARRSWPHRQGDRSDTASPSACQLPKQQPGAGKHKPSCGARLTDTVTTAITPDGHLEAATTHLAKLINSGVVSPDALDARQQLGDLFLLATRALTALHTGLSRAPAIVGQILAEAGGTAPPEFAQLGQTSAHAVAVGTALAVLAHTRQDDDATAVLTWIVAHGQRLANPQPHQLLSRWRQCQPPLLARIAAAVDPMVRRDVRLRHKTSGPNPTLAIGSTEHARRRAASVPSLFWPDWTMRLIPASVKANNRLTPIRAALSVLILVPGTRISHADAAQLLGGYAQPASIGPMLTRLPDDGAAQTIIVALGQMADLLDENTAPIDYARRRALFGSHPPEVNRRRYQRLAAAHGWAADVRVPPHPLHLHILNRHLAIQLTGAHPHPKPRNASSPFNPFTAALPRAVRQFVHDEAQRLLRHHRIDEPVTWTPPLPSNFISQLPGIDPDSLSPADLTRALAEHGSAKRPLARLHHATGLNALHLQLFTDVAEPDMPESQWASTAEGTPLEIASAESISYLYHQQHLSIKDIAQLTLQTQGDVRRVIRAQGGQPDSNRARRSDISRQWFEEHYLGTGKTVLQTAAEAGCSRNTLRFYAKKHNIPFGANAPAHNPFAASKRQPPADVIAAFAIRNGTLHIRHVLAAAHYRRQRTAAAALGVIEKTISYSKRKVEQAAGIRIFKADTWPDRIPTPEGQRFLTEAAKALKQLERQDRTPTITPAPPRPSLHRDA